MSGMGLRLPGIPEADVWWTMAQDGSGDSWFVQRGIFNVYSFV